MQTLDKDLADRTTLAPLSFSEEASWHEFTTNPGSFFLRGLTLTVPMPSGGLRSHAESVVAELVARHEIFRTGYETVDGLPYRRVFPRFGHDIIDADAPVYGIFSQDPANLKPNDLFRVWLTPGPDGGKKLSVDLNEMITDSWSAARMHGELTDLLETFASGREPTPRAVAAEHVVAEYSDFAREQREQREQPHAERLVDYWRTTLADVGPPTYVTEDGPDPSGESVGERVTVFADDLTEALRTVCTRLRLSRFMAVVALVNMVLATRSGARDITVCTSTGTRGARYTEVHGNFSNLVLLRTVLPRDPSFAELATLTRTTILGGLAHLEMPFLRLGEIVPGGVAAPPVRVHYLPHRIHHYQILDTKESGESWREDAMFATWPMEVGFAEDRRGRIAIWLNYDAQRYTHASMERLIRDCCDVLRAVGTDTGLTCGALSERLVFAG